MPSQLLDAVARWGPWVLAASMLLPATRLWRLFRSRAALPRRSWVAGLIANGSWLVIIGIGLWVLQVRLAPLTGSLVTLQSGTGRKVPAISFRSVSDDSPHHLRDYEGKVVLLNLWATYCPPCIREMPELGRLQEAYRDSGLVVIALTDESPEYLRRFFQRYPGEALAGYTKSFDWLKVKTFRPFTLIIDRNGVLRNHFFGAASYEGFESRIRPYL